MHGGDRRKQPLSLYTHVHATTKKSQKFLCPQEGATFKTKILDVNEGEILFLLRSWGEEEVNLLPGNENQPNLDA